MRPCRATAYWSNMVSCVSGTAAAILDQGSFQDSKSAAPGPPSLRSAYFALSTMAATISTVQAQLSSTDAFVEALATSKVKDEFKVWLKTEKIESLEDIALMASSEATVDKEIIDLSNAGTDGGAKVIGAMEKVAVRRLWLIARGLYDQKTAPTNGRNLALASAPSANLDVPLSPELQISTDAAWLQKHGFTLPTAHMVMAASLGRIYRQAHAKPPELSVWLLEKVRTIDCADAKTATALTIVNGKHPSFEEVFAEEVEDHYQIFLRTRALFSSIAFACIDMSDWFGYADALNISDFILELVDKRYDNRRAPVQYLVNAFVAMMQHFVEEVRTNHRTLKEVVRARNEWQQFWTNFKPDSSSHSVQQPSRPAISPSLDKEMRDAQNLAKTLRGQLNQSQNELNAAREKSSRASGGKQNFGKRNNNKKRRFGGDNGRAREGGGRDGDRGGSSRDNGSHSGGGRSSNNRGKGGGKFPGVPRRN